MNAKRAFGRKVRLPKPLNGSRIAAQTRVSGKRYRPRELIIEVPNESAAAIQRALERQYGVEISDLGIVSRVGARVLRLRLSRHQNSHALLARLLQDRRILSAQPNYIYSPVHGAPQSGEAAPRFREQGLKIAVLR